MKTQKIGHDFPSKPRQTALAEAELWYQEELAKRLNRPMEPIKRSNFGQYDMAVNYLTSVLEEARAVEKVAIFNIDHMAQIEFKGDGATALLNRVLPADIATMKRGQCKYTLLLNEQGGVQDDMIVMRLGEEHYIAVVNAGHDITGTGIIDGKEITLTSDADQIAAHLKPGENPVIRDISDQLVKIDIQGPLSFKLIKNLYGDAVLRNPRKPEKNMGFFTFNQVKINGHDCILSRTGYTNRWGWECYFPVEIAEAEFKKIATAALDLGGLVVGLGGRDENRLSAGPVGLPLMGQEYTPDRPATGSPLFAAAVDMDKETFVGKDALEKDRDNPQTQALIITEGIVTGRSVYIDGRRIGTVTSSINSPNVPLEKRLFIGSARKGVNEENGTAAIGLAWFEQSPLTGEEPQRVKIECYREDASGNPKGKPVLGFISPDGVNPATAPKPLKKIEKL